MERFIKAGGAGIILAVFGIFIFILWQTLPLFRQAEVRPLGDYPTPSQDAKTLGVDEWSERPFVVGLDGVFHFLDLTRDGAVTDIRPDWPEDAQFTTASYNQANQTVAFGTTDGRVALANVAYKPVFGEDGKRSISADVKVEKPIKVGAQGAAITYLTFDDDEQGRIIGVIQQTEHGKEARLSLFKRKTSLMGRSRLRHDEDITLGKLGVKDPTAILVNAWDKRVSVSCANGELHLFEHDGDTLNKVQTIRPFSSKQDPGIHSMHYLLGRSAISITASDGTHLIYQSSRNKETNKLELIPGKTFEPLGGAAGFHASSLRNRSFLTGRGAFASLRYSTTAAIRWQSDLPFDILDAVISGKHDRMLFLDTVGGLHLYELDDPHPEAGLSAFFGKILYEGQSEASYTWQSTGGTDEFEPKFSMMPLIAGSLKGTFYAMLFAVPIAILAAIYSALFLDKVVKHYVKPAMEIMASLPSVVLGFLGALWLAPLIEDKIPAIMLMFIVIPAAAFMIGWAWQFLPVSIRISVRPGYEFLFYMVVLVPLAYLCWQAGGAVERLLFTVTDPVSGKAISDFRMWWPEATGLAFEQRNSLVVGFMMGFAVIPIIFTITDDALTNVPTNLTSGSLALGASRWQTAMRVVLPTASAGIFSAIMIAFGRAVGETMIVVMATGNTPIMDWNIFNGFRALSANIAVELPEAPKDGTLYRTLFLGALILFLFTFAINTAAEILRLRLKNRFKTVH